MIVRIAFIILRGRLGASRNNRQTAVAHLALAALDGVGVSVMPNIAAIILAVGLVIAAGLVGGRYSVSPAMSFGGTMKTNGVVIVDRSTGDARYCIVNPDAPLGVAAHCSAIPVL